MNLGRAKRTRLETSQQEASPLRDVELTATEVSASGEAVHGNSQDALSCESEPPIQKEQLKEHLSDWIGSLPREDRMMLSLVLFEVLI